MIFSCYSRDRIVFGFLPTLNRGLCWGSSGEVVESDPKGETHGATPRENGDQRGLFHGVKSVQGLPAKTRKQKEIMDGVPPSGTQQLEVLPRIRTARYTRSRVVATPHFLILQATKVDLPSSDNESDFESSSTDEIVDARFDTVLEQTLLSASSMEHSSYNAAEDTNAAQRINEPHSNLSGTRDEFTTSMQVKNNGSSVCYTNNNKSIENDPMEGPSNLLNVLDSEQASFNTPNQTSTPRGTCSDSVRKRRTLASLPPMSNCFVKLQKMSSNELKCACTSSNSSTINNNSRETLQETSDSLSSRRQPTRQSAAPATYKEPSLKKVSRNSSDKRRPEIPQIILRQFNPIHPSPKMLPKVISVRFG